MAGLAARVTGVLRDVLVAQNGFVTADGSVYMGSGGVVDVTKLAEAAEQHYRPRIETVEQLDALPLNSLIKDASGAVYENNADFCTTEPWWYLGDTGTCASTEVALPAVVLWTPGAGE